MDELWCATARRIRIGNAIDGTATSIMFAAASN
jgi:hypothetical protein